MWLVVYSIPNNINNNNYNSLLDVLAKYSSENSLWDNIEGNSFIAHVTGFSIPNNNSLLEVLASYYLPRKTNLSIWLEDVCHSFWTWSLFRWHVFRGCDTRTIDPHLQPQVLSTVLPLFGRGPVIAGFMAGSQAGYKWSMYHVEPCNGSGFYEQTSFI